MFSRRGGEHEPLPHPREPFWVVKHQNNDNKQTSSAPEMPNKRSIKIPVCSANLHFIASLKYRVSAEKYFYIVKNHKKV